MGIKNIVISDSVDPHIWDEHAAALGGGFFHCHAGAIYRSRVTQAAPLFVEAKDDAGNCIGLAAGTVSRSRVWPFSRYCQIASFPATPIAGGDGEVEASLLRAIENELRPRGVFRVEFASHHSPNSDPLLPEADYSLTPRYDYHFDLSNDLDDMFSSLASQRRNQVRRAEKKGVVTVAKTDPQASDIVRHFHDVSMQRRNEPTPPLKPWVSAARKDLLSTGHAQVLVSSVNGEDVCAYMLVVFNGMVYGMESGSSELGNRTFGPVGLRWWAVRHFKEAGASCLSIGGAREHEKGLSRFKLEFGTIETPQPAGRKIISPFGNRLDSVRSTLRGLRRPGRAKARPKPVNDQKTSAGGNAT